MPTSIIVGYARCCRGSGGTRTARWNDPQVDAGGRSPGDVVLLDTLPVPGPDHIGIISNRAGDEGLPLVVNGWTDGYRTSEMNLLGTVPVLYRFRAPCHLKRLAAADAGLAGVFKRSGVDVPKDTQQVVLVTSERWGATWAEMQRFERTHAGKWQPVGLSSTVNLGQSGLGWGRGLHGGPRAGEPAKAEGDGRSPAGVFDLGTAFGTDAAAPEGTRWPWRQMGARDQVVDDVEAPLYNMPAVEPDPPATPPWKSAEKMTRDDGQYALGGVIRHNDAPPVKGAGSAIFLHVQAGPGVPTTGCTSMARPDLDTLVRWLDPARHPVLVQVVGAVL